MGNSNDDVNSNERNRLLQEDIPQRLIPANPLELVTLYDLREGLAGLQIFCALIPNSAVSKVLEKADWDLRSGDGRPSFDHDEHRVTRYQRFSQDSGIEPFIFARSYDTAWHSPLEVSEEFRLFHNLYLNAAGELWMRSNTSEEIRVGLVTERTVSIQLGLIRQYIAVRQMHLAVYYVSHETSTVTIPDLGFEPAAIVNGEVRKNTSTEFLCDMLAIVKYDDDAVVTLSRKRGKILIAPYPQDHNSVRYFYSGPPPTYEEFVIGVDAQGSQIRHTCDPEKLANDFGLNREAPNYMTKVLFNKSVLDKYYGEPSRFIVEDGCVRCKGSWIHKMDNHRSDGVLCALGDLGDLPASEQAYWKSHNIPPFGNWSVTTAKRWLGAEFTDSERIEDLFASAYADLQRVSEELWGWSLLQPLHVDDEQHLSNVRLPTKNEQVEFDGIIASLAKVVIDSIDSKNLKKLIPKEYADTLEAKDLDAGIKVLLHVLKSREVLHHEHHIKTLRDLQTYRSKSTAHRRGSNWKDALHALNPEGRPLREVASRQIKKVIESLAYFADSVPRLVAAP